MSWNLIKGIFTIKKPVFHLHIPESVECIDQDIMGKPVGILNPIFELYFESKGSIICDYDRVLLSPDGVWHWEHEDYYPEYAVACSWELNYPENLSYYYNRPPDSFPGYIEPEHPEWGSIVNSLCWYHHHHSIDSFVKKDFDLLPVELSEGYIAVNGVKLVNFGLNVYVNPDKWKYAPKGSSLAERVIKAPANYVHWLTLGVSENESSIFVFYPKEPKHDIKVKIRHGKKVYTIDWWHGSRGLFIMIEKYVDENIFCLRKRTADFFKQAINIAQLAQQQYDLLKNISRLEK